MKPLMSVILLLFVLGCSNTPPPGLLTDQLGLFTVGATSCWYCGNYTGPVKGASSLTSPQRICGTGPRWSGSCPSTTMLGDGSTWQFNNSCTCP